MYTVIQVLHVERERERERERATHGDRDGPGNSDGENAKERDMYLFVYIHIFVHLFMYAYTFICMHMESYSHMLSCTAAFVAIFVALLMNQAAFGVRGYIHFFCSYGAARSNSQAAKIRMVTVPNVGPSVL